MSDKIKILYVDDESNNLVAFRSYFRKEYEVFTAISVKEAFDILQTNSIPIIISDLRMPGTSGVEFLEQTIKTHPDSIRIIITAQADIEMVIASINRGQITKFIQKPWDWEMLSLAIENCALLYKSKQELKKTNDELSKANDELNKFVYSISHDLRSPLMSMLGIVHLAKIEEEKTDKMHYFDMIETCVSKLDLFIKNMIDYYKNSRAEVQNDTIDFNNLAQSVLDALPNKDPNMKVELIVDQQSDFMGDAIRLQVILNNLVSNAIKYQNLKQDKRFVKLKIVVNEETATILVSDNGIGITKEHLGSIFKLFFRSDNSTDKQGTGIGLYIVKESVEKIGGQISVSSTPMIGTNFEILIPNRKETV